VILSVLLSATFTFTATATGVEKGTPIEFFIAGPNTDRAYESMFMLDESVSDFCKRIEAAVPRGTPIDAGSSRLWPTGCRVQFEPSFDRFVTETLPEGEKASAPVFTGGTRLTNDTLEADTIMPAAVFSTYSLPQAPIVYGEPVDQGTAYGRYVAAQKLEKGKRFSFKMIVDETSAPRKIAVTAEKGTLQQVLQQLKDASADGEVDAVVSFAESMTVEESESFARALSVIDSSRVKLNGARGLFYRAFLPLEKWRDRRERLQQPFELTLRDDGSDELLFIEEDWTVEGNDPKLTPRTISYGQVTEHPQTTTCFVFAAKTQTVERISSAMRKFPSGQIVNWYVFQRE